MSANKKTMLFIGEQWHGSSARSLASALRGMGWQVDTIDPWHYMPLYSSFLSRVFNKVFRSFYTANFNRAILVKSQKMNPEVVFIYKGNGVRPKTLDLIHKEGALLSMYYPDVSLHTHGKEIPQCISRYDIIFTSKSFSFGDLRELGAKEIHLSLHAASREVHRPQEHTTLTDELQCDVSFIGTWSPKKEKILSELKKQMPNLHLRIWGTQWEKSTCSALTSSIEHAEMMGDYYATAIQASRINLGLLSEKRPGSSDGDQTTTRTFEIPGCSGFQLHERTDEVLTCFDEGVEIECFSDGDELTKKVQYYHSNNSERLAVAEAGHKRCLQEHYYERRAETITQHLFTALQKRISNQAI